MGFLEDIGRTNALSSQMKSIADLSLNLRRQANSERTQAVNEKSALINQDIAKIKLNDLKRQNEELQKPYDITVDPTFQGLAPEVQNQALNDMKSLGIIDDKGIGPRGKIMNFANMVEKSAPLFKKYMFPTVMKWRLKVDNLVMQKQQLENKGVLPTDKKMQALDAQINATRMQYQNSLAIYKGHLKKLEEGTQKTFHKTVQTPQGPQVGLFDAKTGRLIKYVGEAVVKGDKPKVDATLTKIKSIEGAIQKAKNDLANPMLGFKDNPKVQKEINTYIKKLENMKNIFVRKLPKDVQKQLEGTIYPTNPNDPVGILGPEGITQ